MFENNPDGMFCSLGNSRLVHANHLRDQNKWSLKHYELAGKVVGKCLFETAMGGFYKQMVNGRFTRSFLGQIIGFTPHYKVQIFKLIFFNSRFSFESQFTKVCNLLF